jgi:hypothetical protein
MSILQGFEIKLGHLHTTTKCSTTKGRVAAADEVASEQKAVVKDHRAHLDEGIAAASPALIATAFLREVISDR